MRTVLYARYSTDLQNPKSCDDQIALLTDRCKKEGWEIVGIYSDESIRGAAGLTEEARPGISRLLAHLQRGGVDQVFAEVSSRLARDVSDIMQIYALARFYGARLFTVADGELTYITASVKGMMDASQSKAIADHVKRGQRATIMDGRCPGGIAYGYRIANTIGQNGRAIRGLRVIDDEQAAIVLRIFTEYAANESPKRIAERLNDDGIPGPRGRAWKASTIYGDEKRKNGILQNRLYIGQLVLNRTSKALHPIDRKERIRPNPETDWIIKEKPELRIVSDEVWIAVKDRRAQSAAKPFRLQRRPKRLLSGLGHCVHCGGPWIVIGDERWGCANRKNGHGCSNNRSITTQQYEKRVLGGLQEKMLDPALVATFVKEYHTEYARQMAEQSKQRPKLEQRQLDVNHKIANLVGAIADGGAAFKEIANALTQAKAEQAQIEAELRDMAAVPVVAIHPGIADQYRKQVRELAQALSQDEETRRHTAKVVRGLIDRIILSPKAGERGVNIEVSGRLATILSLASGKPVPANMYAGDGGSGNRKIGLFLPENLTSLPILFLSGPQCGPQTLRLQANGGKLSILFQMTMRAPMDALIISVRWLPCRL